MSDTYHSIAAFLAEPAEFNGDLTADISGAKRAPCCYRPTSLQFEQVGCAEIQPVIVSL